MKQRAYLQYALFCVGKVTMSDVEFDFVVVGAGIVGSWTAKELKKHGKVLLLEQFREPHTRGSSHGQTRVIRSSYAEPFYAEMMPHAYKMWRQAELEMNEKLIETTGILCIADTQDDKELQDSTINMKRICPEHLVELSIEDLKLKYPTTLKYASECGVILDKSGGTLFAHKAVRVVQEWFQKSGGIFWDYCKVINIIPSEKKVKVITNRGEVFAKSLVVCSGAWTKELISHLGPCLPLEAQAVKVYYWKEKEVGAYSAASGFPIVLSATRPYVYALPSLEYQGLVKVCLHGVGVPCNPNERDKVPVDKEKEDLVRNYIRRHFPLLESEPSIVETCMYTCTPDEICVIDTLPGYKNIVIGTGFSGTGFKKSPVVGRLLSELAKGVDPFLDLSPYRLSRFNKGG